MKKHVYLYKTSAEREEISSANPVSVLFTQQTNQVEYTYTGIEHDYSKDYLTFEALQDTTFTFTTNALQYSLDNGSTWTTLAANTASPTVTAGNKIMWKQTGLSPTSSAGIGTFSSTGNFNAQGNIMSLYYGDIFKDQTSLSGKNYAFYKLFNGCTNLISCQNLILSVTTLETSCYGYMFQGCTALTTAPELPATTLANYCYSNMFYKCTSLTTAPALPTTTLTKGCYTNMFKDCKGLITVPELPATTLTSNCYEYMFMGCTSLTTAPSLPATTLNQYCYQYMFYGCTKLTVAPELPATTLARYCYYYMFYSCTNLNYIKCLATNISAEFSHTAWVSYVASSGTFVKAFSMTSWPSGTNGIPTGWTVVTNEHSGGTSEA